MIGHRAKRSHRHQVHGFTLIDMVMVLSIISVATAIAVPRLGSGQTRYRADATARRVVADLEWARTEAMARSGPIEVYFDFGGHSYFLYNIESINHNYVDNWVQLQHDPYGAELISAFGDDINDAGTSLWFDGHGKPNRDGMIVIEVGTEQRSIRVDGETGRVSMVD